MSKEETETLFSRQDDLLARTYEKSRPRVCAYIAGRIGDRTEAEDLTQDVFCRLLESNYFIDESTIMRLIFSIARNLVIDWYRRHAYSKAATEFFCANTRIQSCRTEEEIRARELEGIERRAVAGLPERRRQVYILCVMFGLDVESVAARLEISRRTAENHLFAARQQVRRAIAV